MWCRVSIMRMKTWQDNQLTTADKTTSSQPLTRWPAHNGFTDDLLTIAEKTTGSQPLTRRPVHNCWQQKDQLTIAEKTTGSQPLTRRPDHNRWQDDWLTSTDKMTRSQLLNYCFWVTHEAVYKQRNNHVFITALSGGKVVQYPKRASQVSVVYLLPNCCVMMT